MRFLLFFIVTSVEKRQDGSDDHACDAKAQTLYHEHETIIYQLSPCIGDNLIINCQGMFCF